MNLQNMKKKWVGTPTTLEKNQPINCFYIIIFVTDSEEETGPRLKPVFVRKKDRITVLEKEREAMKEKQAEIEAKKMAEERKKQTLRVRKI